MQYLHIGFYKTGSTYLQEHFFPRLQHEVITNEGMIGHPSNGFSDWREKLDKIADKYQSPKILIVFRRQPEIIESLYKHGVWKGYPGSIESYMGIQPGLKGHHKMAQGADWKCFRYDEIVAGYQDQFGKDNVLAIPYEMMKSDLEDFCNTIADFFDCARIPVIRSASNKGSNAALHHHYLFRNRIYSRPTKSRAMRFGIVKIFQGATMIIGSAFRPAKPMAENIRSMIVSHHATANRRLSDLVGRDLGQYGYFQG